MKVMKRKRYFVPTHPLISNQERPPKEEHNGDTAPTEAPSRDPGVDIDTAEDNTSTHPIEAAGEDVQATVDDASEVVSEEATTTEANHDVVEEGGTGGDVVQQEEDGDNFQDVSEDVSVVENVDIHSGDTANDMDRQDEADVAGSPESTPERSVDRTERDSDNLRASRQTSVVGVVLGNK